MRRRRRVRWEMRPQWADPQPRKTKRQKQREQELMENCIKIRIKPKNTEE